jgi:Ner family transcriptional regulator
MSIPSHWDRYAIRAAVHRRGKSLTELARDAGVFESACREALVRPCTTGERLIADFLCVPLHELWPERHAAPSSAKTSLKGPSKASQKPAGQADSRRVA